MAKTAHSHQARLKAVEILLLWEGRVSRPRLAELFDVHGTVLSRDMATYVELAPDNCRYDTSSRAYLITPYAKPQLTEGHFHEYEGLVGTLPANGLHAGVELVSTHQHATNITYRPFSRIHTAVREGKQIKIEYSSLSNPEKHERTIRPHAFIQAGPRWHVRAYCDQAKGFRDFNLGRIAVAHDPDPTEMPSPSMDHEWHNVVMLRLSPHPQMTPSQQDLIRREYMRGAVHMLFEIRQPIAKYVVQSYRAAIDPTKESPPEFLLAVLDADTLPPNTLILNKGSA